MFLSEELYQVKTWIKPGPNQVKAKTKGDQNQEWTRFEIGLNQD